MKKLRSKQNFSYRIATAILVFMTVFTSVYIPNPNIVKADETPTVSILASPGSVTSGQSSTLTWSSTDATSCEASGDWSGAKALSGSESTGSLTTGKTYTIACSGAGGTATAFTFVTVTAAPTPPPPPTPPTGQITFCLILADQNNVIATSSSGLPAGVFSLNLASSTDFGSNTVQSKTWITSSFSPNRSIILSGQFDSDCATYDNLPLGTYYYSELSVNGALWLVPQYNDQETQSVNNIFDFFLYSSELFNATTTDDAGRNLNSDGQITLTVGNSDKTVVIVEKDDMGTSCPAPEITSPLTASGTVGLPFTYFLTASSSTATTFSVGALPAGLSFSTTTNSITGTPSTSGTFSVSLNAVNQCIGGIDIETLVITIAQAGGHGRQDRKVRGRLKLAKAGERCAGERPIVLDDPVDRADDQGRLGHGHKIRHQRPVAAARGTGHFEPVVAVRNQHGVGLGRFLNGGNVRRGGTAPKAVRHAVAVFDGLKGFLADSLRYHFADGFFGIRQKAENGARVDASSADEV